MDELHCSSNTDAFFLHGHQSAFISYANKAKPPNIRNRSKVLENKRNITYFMVLFL